MQPPETCPHCGADVPLNARACPECGSDESTGWSERARSDALGLPDDGFDYDEFVKREFAPASKSSPTRNRFWWIAAVLALVAFLFLLFR